MAVFTPVSEAELSAWLGDYALGPLRELQPIASGIENTNFFVTTSGGRFVLTLFEKLTEDELPFYLNLIAHLSRHGIPCPAPMADRHNRLLGHLNGKPACIATRLSGRSLTDPGVPHCAALGEMLARLHLAGQSFTQVMPNPRGAAWRARTVQQVAGFLPDASRALLEAEVALHAGQSLSALPQGVIHADLFRDNVLMEDRAVGGLIDFYFACTDALLYDVAITINDWCLDRATCSLDPERTAAFLNAYHAIRPFEATEETAWPRMLRLAALRFWLSRLYDLHLPRDGELVNPHDPAHFERVLTNHIAAPHAVWR